LRDYSKERWLRTPNLYCWETSSIPEDSGGIGGYEDLLEILKDPGHEEYEDTVEWLGGHFNLEYFDPKDVKFYR
jgi:hypothetical protein